MMRREDRFGEIRRRILSGHDSLDNISFRFRVEGLPRHQFAQHVRARIGVEFDYENPPRAPRHYIPYTPVYLRLFRGASMGSHDGGGQEDPAESVVVSVPDGVNLVDLKKEDVTLESDGYTTYSEGGFNVVKQLLMIPDGPWERIRDYLPLSYEQDYSFDITFRALIGQCSRRLCLGEEAQIVTNHYLQKAALAERFPLLASVLMPTCDRVGKCLYARNYTLSNAFGCLFAGCDYRHPKGTSYASFNESCSDINTLKREVKPAGVIDAMDALVTPESYPLLDPRDKELFVD